ncbi:MAG: T9SS type A sorting domain-containing protein [Ignavibacteria bacterium]|nr:T9SS type A sorting domain-containing protein [Ignavibacteria bacterium]
MYHSREMINERVPNQKCITFAYPYAVHNNLVDSIASIYYESARTIGDYQNPTVINGNEWYSLSSYQVEFNLPRNSPDDDLDELNAFIDWINNSILEGEWGIHLAHEVVPFSEINALLDSGSYHPISNEWLTSLGSWLDTKSSNKEIWIETIANITKYVKERENFYFNIISQNNEVIEIEVSDNLIDEIYDYPLTAYITVPPHWNFILLEQGSKTDVLESFIMDTSTVVMGKVIPDGGNVRISKFIPNSVTENESTQPEDFVLFQNYPNPFNPSTGIRYSLGKPQFVSLKVFDILGNEIATLVNEEKLAGEYRVDFDASSLTSGMYIYTLHTLDKHISKKMLLIK